MKPAGKEKAAAPSGAAAFVCWKRVADYGVMAIGTYGVITPAW